ncbi:MAG: pilus assembly protein N-terminal domain-containing protein [Rhizobiales bacterium]|nr:pilus assembly protein N-terminal domain-containing protein [Hyphomicrobiales bacterium]
MTIRTFLASLAVVGGLCLAAAPAQAAQPLVLFTDQSTILNVPRPAAVVVVGNPSIADATINGQQIFLHGRSFGTTNVIALDDQGAKIANYEVTVQLGGSNNVTLFKAGMEYSYVCVTNCEVQMHVGDDQDWFQKVVLGRNKDKIGIATGQKSAEANQPPPAQ